MRKLLYKVKKLIENLVVDNHRDVLGIEKDTMLIEVTVRRILEIPAPALNINVYGAEILSCRVGRMTCKAHVFGTKLTLRISYCFLCLCRCNITGVFFGL